MRVRLFSVYAIERHISTTIRSYKFWDYSVSVVRGLVQEKHQAGEEAESAYPHAQGGDTIVSRLF
jgi:hypothetical protein